MVTTTESPDSREEGNPVPSMVMTSPPLGLRPLPIPDMFVIVRGTPYDVAETGISPLDVITLGTQELPATGVPSNVHVIPVALPDWTIHGTEA